MEKRVLLIAAGPNGAGKSTFIQGLMRRYAFQHVVNPDALQRALGATGPAGMSAGREALLQVDAWLYHGQAFIWESTLASRSQAYTGRIRRAIDNGYQIQLHMLWLSSAEVCLKRIASRVQAGGHGIPEADVRRRYPRIARHFFSTYQCLADEWSLWDNDVEPRLVARGTRHGDLEIEGPGVWRQFVEVAGEHKRSDI